MDPVPTGPGLAGPAAADGRYRLRHRPEELVRGVPQLHEPRGRASPDAQSREALFARFLEWRQRQQEPAAGQPINILTGSTSGVYYPLGNALSEIYRKVLPGAQVTVQETQGSVQNLNLLQVGRGDVAFALADPVGFAWKGDAEMGFPQKLGKLRTIASIYPNYIQIVATKDSGIETLADLQGKRVSVGAPRSGTEINARRVFQAAGLSYDKMAVEYLLRRVGRPDEGGAAGCDAAVGGTWGGVDPRSGGRRADYHRPHSGDGGGQDGRSGHPRQADPGRHL